MSGSEWKEYKLSELMTIIGGGTPKTSIPEYWNGDIPWLSVKDFAGDNRFVYKTEKYITKEGLKNSSTKLLNKGDLIISARGTVGEVAQLKFDMTFNQSCYGLRANENTTNNFLFYLIKYTVRNIKKHTHGSVFDTITRKTFDNITVRVPTFNEQSKITNILSSLDKKIELNNQINQTLEEMAQAIFKHWFVDFEFPNENGEPYKSSGGKFVESELGMIPEGWEIGTFRTYTNNIIGGDWGKETPQANYVKEVRCLRGADIPEVVKGNEGALPERYILEKNHQNKRLEPGDIVIEISGGSPTQSTGRIAYITDQLLSKFPTDLVCTNFCRVVTLKDKTHMEFFYYYWKRLYNYKIFFQFENGTTGIKNLDINSFLDSYKIVIPEDKQLKLFHKKISALLKKVQENGRENRKLDHLRDLLLPKLMSGEIRIPDAEQEVEKCL